jgi:hypothetical protein
MYVELPTQILCRATEFDSYDTKQNCYLLPGPAPVQVGGWLVFSVLEKLRLVDAGHVENGRHAHAVRLPVKISHLNHLLDNASQKLGANSTTCEFIMLALFKVG